MKRHKTVAGDCISSVAASAKVGAGAILADPSNEDLVQTRPDPNQLVPGDTVVVPKVRPARFERKTGECHVFQLPDTHVTLRLSLRRSGKPVDSEPFELLLGGQTLTGTTDADGRLEVQIPATETAARLRLVARDEIYQLKVGHLEPATATTGMRQRLHNLGRWHGDEEGLVAATLAFQSERGLDPTGVLDAATGAALRDDHGC